MPDVQIPLAIDDIEVGPNHRPVVDAAVKRIAESIKQIGLQHPVTVVERGEKYLLVAGRHRMEACKRIGRDYVNCNIVKMNKYEARLWEISENLHRADLTKLERDEQVAEWISITERISSQNATKPGRPEGGVRAAARDLGVDKDDAHRAVKVASLTDEAKEAARETGLDDNRSALLTAARAPKERQSAVIRELARPKDAAEVTDAQFQSLVSAWNRAGEEAREKFRAYIDAPVMDARYA